MAMLILASWYLPRRDKERPLYDSYLTFIAEHVPGSLSRRTRLPRKTFRENCRRPAVDILHAFRGGYCASFSPSSDVLFAQLLVSGGRRNERMEGPEFDVGTPMRAGILNLAPPGARSPSVYLHPPL